MKAGTGQPMMAVERILLTFAGLLLAAGAVTHAAAFSRASAVIGESSLPPFYSNTFKVFWVADSSTMMIGATIFLVVAVRPAVATRTVIVLLSLVYAAIAVLIYSFIGGFFAGHMLMAASAAAFIGGSRLSGSKRAASGTAVRVRGAPGLGDVV